MGTTRQEVRVRWWDTHATTFKFAAIGIDDRLDELPDLPQKTMPRFPAKLAGPFCVSLGVSPS
jgi:hypothetical protein